MPGHTRWGAVLAGPSVGVWPLQVRWVANDGTPVQAEDPVAVTSGLAAGEEIALRPPADESRSEPPGNLDSATAGEIVALLGALSAAGTTVILVTHEADIAAFAGRRVHLRDGRVATRTRARL